MARRNIPISVEDDIARRLVARAADLGEDLPSMVRSRLLEWLGDWGMRSITHIVQPKETLWAIAERYYGDGTKSAVLAAYNDIESPELLAIGTSLVVPEPTVEQPLRSGESPFIFGLHDRGGEYLMARAARPGWVLCTEPLGSDPEDRTGKDYRDLEQQGFGVIVRLNNGYGRGGTIAPSDHHGEFAIRCGNFCERSPGCHIWVVGNEPNVAVERPGGPQFGEVITPSVYAAAYRACREEIRSRSGHEADQVVTAAIGPWNTQTSYDTNPSGDWITYFEDMLNLLDGEVDGIALHTYSRDADPKSITSDEMMSPPFEHRRAHFRTYVDFMNAIPSTMRNAPVYITEANQNQEWADVNHGWIRAAYSEIDRWNGNPSHQKIRALVLYRWQVRPNDVWHLEDKPEAIADFRMALQNDCRWRV